MFEGFPLPEEEKPYPRPGRPPDNKVTCGRSENQPNNDTQRFFASVPRAIDAVPETWKPPKELAEGKSSAVSLLQPQKLANRLLPAGIYSTIYAFSTQGVPTDCGDNWPDDVIQVARNTGPHVSALSPENIKLIWEEIDYQTKAGFVRCIQEHELFRSPYPENLKISRLAVVPQRNRRGRLILNLSAPVELPAQRTQHSRRKASSSHPSVNATTTQAEDQTAVKLLGTALADILLFSFETPCHWEIRWSKIDLSDGFWRMIVQTGAEYNFVFELPQQESDTQRWFVIPSSLQMGWTNSPAYFCTATEAGRLLIQRLLAFSAGDKQLPAHALESYCTNNYVPLPTTMADQGDDFVILLRVFVDDYIQ